MSKIDLNDNGMDIVVKMSDGNPGAIHAIMDLMKNAEAIDPQSLFTGLGPILLLDTYEIYGTEIYILYADQCNKEVRKLVLLLRATQLGIFPNIRLKTLAADQMRTEIISDIEWIDIDNKVCAQLVDFAKA